MRKLVTMLALMAAACASPAAEAPSAPDAPAAATLSLADILAQSPASDWRPLDPENTIYMELPQGRVIIELAPHYAPNHAINIRALARAHYYDGAAIIRSQDNYVVQWGRPDEDPAPMGEGRENIPGEVTRSVRGVEFTPFRDPDTYAPSVGFSHGFPVARAGGETWLTHCYGMVGSARGEGLDSGSGAQLYAINGQSPRNLDRNITVVGRVVLGMDILATFRRGTGALGFYETPGERTQIRSIRVASDVPAAERVNLETLRTDSATWARVVDSRRTRRETFFANYPVNRIGVCNISVPVRPIAR